MAELQTDSDSIAGRMGATGPDTDRVSMNTHRYDNDCEEQIRNEEIPERLESGVETVSTGGEN